MERFTPGFSRLGKAAVTMSPRGYVALLRHTDTMLNELEVGRRTMSGKGLDEQILLQPGLLSKNRGAHLFLWGEEDPFGSPDVARDLVIQIPNAELELLPGAGHAVWLDDPDYAAPSR